MPNPRPFLFDIGNVICAFDFDPMIARLKERSTDAGADPISRFIETKESYESGNSSDDAFIAHVTEAIGFLGDHEEFVSIWTEIFSENQPMTAAIETLAAAGHPLYLLSNTNGLHVEYLLKTFPVFEHFSGGVYSHEAKAIKPLDQIYEIAFERYSLNPEETYYVDDLPRNIEAGNRFGLISHQYHMREHDAFITWLAENGIATPAR